MKVTVKAPFQVNHAGKNYTGGDTLDAPEGKANRWVAFGWAEKAKPTPARAQKPGEDISQFHTGGGWYEIDGEKVRGEDAAKDVLAKHKKVPEPSSE